MRHRVAHRKLGRVTEHRLSLLRNQAQALIRYEHIQTTVPKAKELRPFVERLITIAKRGIATGEPARSVHARRLVARDLASPDVVSKLFDQVAPRFEKRPGGYTRVLKVGPRRGDNAEVARIELVGSEYNPNLDSTSERDAAATKGVRGRLQAAAQRWRTRGKKGGEAAAEAQGEETAAVKPRASRKKKAEEPSTDE